MSGFTPSAPAGTSPTRLRQIALIAEDLDRARHTLTTVLDTEVVFVDPLVEQWGLKNILVAIGGDIIEVCSPFKPNTTVGRLLEKRGDGGYMIIMQTADATARRRYIEEHNLAKVIFGYEHDDAVGVQYHPKGIAGGMMPELDSHRATEANPTPLTSPFSPWHACGPDHERYTAAMRRRSYLRLLGATLRLAPGQSDAAAAAQQWQRYFGVEANGDGLTFTNARLAFVPGVEGQPEGLESITIEVLGKERLDRMLLVAREQGLCTDGWIDLLGVKWFFVLEDDVTGDGRQVTQSKL